MRRITPVPIMLFLISAAGTLHAQSKIHGRVTDENTKPIIAASVLLRHAKDSLLVKGAVTDNSGYYSFDNIIAGTYLITLSGAGYPPVTTKAFEVLREDRVIDKGALQLLPGRSSLSNVTVTARRHLYEQKIDRLVINVAGSITSAGSNALEILERSPGVTVNRQDNTISIMGKDGVNILNNGKPTHMTPSAIVQMLEGMSAGNIDKIELITTPPANFDAEGNAGFINIVFKQNNNFGTNGSVSATLGYGRGWAEQGSLNFNHRKKKISLYGDFSVSNRVKPFELTGYARVSNSGDINEIYSSINDMDSSWQYNTRLGLDYQLNHRTTIGILLTANGRAYETINYNGAAYYINGQPDTLITGTNDQIEKLQDYGINLGLQYNLRNGDNLFFNGYYLHYKIDQPTNYHDQFYDKAGYFVFEEYRNTSKLTPLYFLIGMVDYTKKLSKKISMDAGIKSTLASFTNDFSLENFIQNNWVNDPSLSAVYTLKEDYYAAYVSFNITPGEKTTIKGGLRYEYTNSNLGARDQKDIIYRQYGKLFPSFFFSQKLDENNILNLSYNSRITRPTFNDLAPFTYFNSRKRMITGNPALQPAISHVVKLDYSFKKYLLGVAFSQENNSITSFQPSVDSVTTNILVTSKNLKNQKLASLILSVPVKAAKWWSMQYNLTGIWRQVNGWYQDKPYHLEGENIILNMAQNFTLPKNFFIELTGSYWSPALAGIGTSWARASLDAGIRKKFGTNHVLTFNAANILNSMRFGAYVNLPEQNVVNEVKINSLWRTFKITYILNFGNTKLQAKRNRNSGAEDEKSRVQY